MSTTIDNKVVEMKFDNRQFESGVKESMSTLQKLKEALKFDNANKSLQSLGDAAKGIDLSGLQNSVQSISDRFSTMGIVGMTIVQNLTNAALNGIKNIATAMFNMAKNGGISRAMNIETAKFQLEGLGVAWKDIADDIDYAVSGTAYGLDAAARAASQLVASNVEVGDSMKVALRGISGVAAMTNSEYDDIARVFTTVAGNGRLMGDQLNQLSSRGINAAATLAKAFNTTESEIRQMVSKGQISFADFAKAMDDAFGEHAKDANKTFTGVISNIKSAFSRIGADFVTPIVQNESPIVLMLQRVRERVNDLKSALQPLVSVWVDAINTIGSVGQDLFKNMDLTKPIVLFYTSINIIKNSFISLLSFISPIQKAFRDIFPKQSLDSVITLALAIKDFMATLELSSKHAEQLKIAFEGVFSVFSLLIDFVKAVVNALFMLGSSSGDVSDGIFNLAENFGKLLLAITNFLRNTENVTEVFERIKESVSSFIDRIADAIASFSGINTGGFKVFANEMRESASVFQIVENIISGVFHTVYSVVSSIVPKLTTVIAGFGGVLKQFTTNLYNAFGNTNTSEASTILNGGILAFLLIKLKSLVGAITGQINTLKSVFDGGLTKVLAQLKDSLFAWQKDLEANALMKLAGAIAILVGSVLLLTGIDTEALAASTIAIGSLMAALVGAMAVFNSITFDTGKLKGILGLSTSTTALIKMASSVLILAIALKSISEIDTASMVKGIAGITALSLILFEFSNLMSKNVAKMTAGISSIITVSIAMRLLVSSVKQLGELKFGDLIKGIVGISALFGEIILFAKSTEKADISKVAAKMISLGTGLLIMSAAVKVLGATDVNSLAKGLGGLGIVLFELSRFLKSLDGAQIRSSAGMMLGLSTGILILSAAIRVLGSMNLADLAKGLIALQVAFIEINAFTKKIKAGDLLKVAAGMTAFSVGVGLMAIAIGAMGSLNLPTLAKGLGTLGAALAEMIIATKLLGNSLTGVAGIVALSGAMLILASAIKVLGSLSIDSVLIALGALAGGLALFGFAATVLTPVLPMVAALAGAIALLGVACLAAGAGMALFVTGMTSLAAISTAAIAGLGATITGLIALIPEIVRGFALLSGELIDAIKSVAPKMIEAVTEIVTSLIESLLGAIPRVTEAGMSCLEGFLKGINSHIGEVAKQGTDLIAAFLSAIGTNVPKIINAAMVLVINFIQGMAQGIRENTPVMVAAVGDLIGSILFAIGAFFGEFVNNGSEIVHQLVEGFNSTGGEAASSFGEIIAKVLLKIGEFIIDFFNAAVDLVSSFIKGLVSMISSVFNAGSSVGSAAASGIANGKGAAEANAAGVEVGTGYSKGIKSTTTEVGKASKGLTITAADTVNKNSKPTIEVVSGSGKKVGKAYGDGILSGAKNVAENVKTYMSNIDTKIATSANNSSGFLDKLSNKLKSTGDVGSDFLEKYKNGQSILGDTSSTKAATNAQNELNESTMDLSESMGDLSKSTGKAGKSAKEAKSDFEELNDAIKQSVSSSLDLFSKFEKKEAMSAEEVLSNMRSQIQGITNWTYDLTQLAQKGISQGLIADLAKLGTDGYDKVQAFLSMTQDQIQEANLWYTQSLLLPDASSQKIMESYAQAGMNASLGYAQGINPDAANASMIELATNSLNALKDILQIHSPSKVTTTYGQYTVQGLANGIKGTLTAQNNAIIMGKNVLEGFKKHLNFNTGKEIGGHIVQGIAAGISEGGNAAKSAAESLAASLPEWVRKVLKINSPSKVFAEIGKFIDMGLVKGVEGNTGDVMNSIDDLAMSVINGYSSGLTDIIDMDLTPVIRPTLDLANVTSGATQIDNLLNGKSISATVDAINQNGVTNNATMESLKAEIVKLGDRLSSMQMVLDSGVLVGELSPGMDAQLGIRNKYAGRGI